MKKSAIVILLCLISGIALCEEYRITDKRPHRDGYIYTVGAWKDAYAARYGKGSRWIVKEFYLENYDCPYETHDIPVDIMCSLTGWIER